jgi:cytochrome P450
MVPVSEIDDLLSDEAVNRPAAYFKKLRDIDPIYWNARWNGWIITSYDAVTAGYRDAARLSSDRFSGPFGAEVRSRGENGELLSFLSKFFVWKDPPYHTQIRSLVFKGFTPRSVEKVRPRVQELVRDLVEPLRHKDSVNFLADFAFHLPVIVIAEYLGIPPEARYDVRDWSDDLAAVVFVSGNDSDRIGRAEAAMKHISEFLRPIVRSRRQDPREDLITALVFAEENGKHLSEEEIIANVMLMVFAGHETTMNLLSNAIVAFDRFPDQWTALKADPTLARSATEEALRYDGPIRGLGRWATETFELGGRQIKERDRVFLFQHAANRDPAAFEDPDGFDVRRWPNKHAAFGQGIHTCLGAPLARLEMQEALTYLTSEFDRIEVLDDTLEYNPTMVSRSLKQLNVRFG